MLSRLFTVFILSITSIVHPSTAQVLPINAFSKHGDYLDMKLSPDGKHLLARTRIEGRVVMFFFDSKTMQVVGGVKPPNNDEIHSATWINNERVVYQYREKSFNFDRPVPTGELFAVNIDGSKATMLFGYRAGESTTGTRMKKRESTRAAAEIISPLVNDDKHILIAEYPFSQEGKYLIDDRKRQPIISRLNVYTGAKRKIEVIPYGGADVFATDEGDIKFIRWSDDELNINSAYRSSDNADWEVFEVSNMDDLIPIALSNDGNTVFLSGEITEKELTTIFQFDLHSKQLSPLFEDISADINDYNWDPELNMPVVGESMPAKVEYHYAMMDGERVTSRVARYHRSLAAAFAGQRISIESQSEDGAILLLHVSSDVNPGEYYLFNTETNKAEFIWANRSWLDPRSLLPQTPISFAAQDGLEINGYLTMPKIEAKQKAPLVIMVHGGPYGIRDAWGFDSETQLLANRGFAVLQVNYRGSGGYGERFITAGHRQWGGLMIDDMLAGIEYVSNAFPINRNRICAYGASYGGYAALMLTVKAPELFKCTVGYVGVYDMNYMYTESDVPTNKGGLAYLHKVIGTDKDELYAYSPVNFADKIKAEVMLIHGNKDIRVSVKNSEKMKANLEAAGKKVEYLNFSKSGHGVYNEAEREDLYSNLIRFLEQNLLDKP